MKGNKLPLILGAILVVAALALLLSRRKRSKRSRLSMTRSRLGLSI